MPAHKVIRRAGMAAPAVIVLGALAAASQFHDFTPAAATSTAPARHHQLAKAHHAGSAEAVNTPARLPESIRSDLYRAPRPKPTPKPTPAREKTGDSSGHTPARPTALRCSGSGGMLPANYATIVGFLTAHGYTGNAAAGIAGNIYQESMGNPESVGSSGGGLIGWTPLPAGFVTGNPAADLQTQVAAILTFNQQWSGYLPALNAATSPAQAADIYVTDFERAGIPATSNREAAANAVAAACGL
jgi:hypothetical protein